MRHLATITAQVLTAVLLFAVPARAQSVSPDALAAAKELVELSKTAESFKTLLPMMMQQIKPVVVQKRSAVERDFDQVVPLVIEAANEQVGKFAEAVAVIWASNFSADELRQVSAFYRTPAGQKFLQQMPVIAQQSMVMGQKFGESLMNDLQVRTKDELRKRGHKI